MRINNWNIRFYNSPFKPLLKPRKISMVGKVFYPNDENSNTYSIATQNSSNNSNINNNKILGNN